MTQASGSSKLIGRFASLLLFIGVAMFFLALFGAITKTLIFVGIAIFAAALAVYYVEELIHRRTT